MPGTWPTGSGTVTLTGARWAGTELLSPADSSAGGGNGTGSYLVPSVTYEAAQGVVPIRWLDWTAKESVTGGRFSPIDTYPPEALEARQPPSFQLEVKAGERRDTTLVFDMLYQPEIEIELVDAEISPFSDVNLLAIWTVATDQGAGTPVPTTTE